MKNTDYNVKKVKVNPDLFIHIIRRALTMAIEIEMKGYGMVKRESRDLLLRKNKRMKDTNLKKSFMSVIMTHKSCVS